MSLNNPALYDAVIALGTPSEGWITSGVATDYAVIRNALSELATEIDSRIPTITTGPSLSQFQLLCGITRSVFAGRSIVDITPAFYSTIASAIAAAFNELSSALQGVPGILALGHIHDDGTTITIADGYNIASVVYAIDPNTSLPIPGIYVVTFTNPIDLDHCDFPAIYHSDITDPSVLSDLGLMFEINFTSPTTLTYCRYDISSTGGPEPGDWSFHVIGRPE